MDIANQPADHASSATDPGTLSFTPVNAGDIHMRQSPFETPLNVQRYQWVGKFLNSDPSLKSVTDFGCGNGRMVAWLKTVEHLEKINFVDSDLHMLRDEVDRFMRPNLLEMLFGRRDSKLELGINVFHGDAGIPDKKLDADCITMVELIEHLLPQDVERATRSIFGYYQPKVVIITTPNSEFNQLLRRPGESPTAFRHYDHKFEWTRAEFQWFCYGVSNTYHYDVEFDGVGKLPGSEPFGHCTQIALFRRDPSWTPQQKDDRDFTYCDLLVHKLNSKLTHADDPDEAEANCNRIELISEFRIPGARVTEDHDMSPSQTSF